MWGVEPKPKATFTNEIAMKVKAIVVAKVKYELKDIINQVEKTNSTHLLTRLNNAVTADCKLKVIEQEIAKLLNDKELNQLQDTFATEGGVSKFSQNHTEQSWVKLDGGCDAVKHNQNQNRR
jgi:hypothetical protein